MSPALKGNAIPRTTGAYPAPNRRPTGDELLIVCRCGWSALRPRHAVASARLAHLIGHDRGWFDGAPYFDSGCAP